MADKTASFWQSVYVNIYTYEVTQTLRYVVFTTFFEN